MDPWPLSEKVLKLSPSKPKLYTVVDLIPQSHFLSEATRLGSLGYQYLSKGISISKYIQPSFPYGFPMVFLEINAHPKGTRLSDVSFLIHPVPFRTSRVANPFRRRPFQRPPRTTCHAGAPPRDGWMVDFRCG